ncbi:Basic-leucine zipper domain [Dillenia turbinata]|uniref:Basic-leucine zipper domain n=1 Tax=Dillenia turbinata TaxID=194707 RepID=A0AAN8ZDF3_9MAGN
MGIQMMGSQGGGATGDKQSNFQPLVRQNSLYSLTLDEVQNQLGDLGKPLSSMNLDELLKNVWSAEANQSMSFDIEGATGGGQSGLQRQSSVSLSGALSKKTVDEVWRDIQQGHNKSSKEKSSHERQPTLGEMTLEDFLVKAGVVVEPSVDKKGPGPLVGVDPNAPPPFSQQGSWMQYPQNQFQHPQQTMMGVYMTGQPIPQPLPIGTGPYPENQAALSSPLMGSLSDTQAPGRKRSTPDNIIGKTVERRQKRMIKNRESAARSRARKQAYTNELENKVSRLEEENERLRKRKELEKMLPSAPPPEPKSQLRRTSSAPF